MGETSRAFHDAIYGLGQFYFSGLTAKRSTAQDLEQGNLDHAHILDALRRRVPEEAERAMRDHIYRTFQVYTVGAGRE